MVKSEDDMISQDTSAQSKAPDLPGPGTRGFLVVAKTVFSDQPNITNNTWLNACDLLTLAA